MLKNEHLSHNPFDSLQGCPYCVCVCGGGGGGGGVVEKKKGQCECKQSVQTKNARRKLNEV